VSSLTFLTLPAVSVEEDAPPWPSSALHTLDTAGAATQCQIWVGCCATSDGLG